MLCDSIYSIMGILLMIVRQLAPASVGAFLVPPNGLRGSLVLRRMDCREHKRGLVRARKHGTKSGSGGPARRGLLPVNADSSPTRRQW